jgi:hypothetical protein
MRTPGFPWKLDLIPESEIRRIMAERDAARSALREARKWIGDGEFSDGLAREHWTPAYAAVVDMVDVALAPSGEAK